MSARIGQVLAGLAACTSLAACKAPSRYLSPDPSASNDRVERIEHRLAELERAALQDEQDGPPGAAVPAGSQQQPTTREGGGDADDIERARQEALRDIESGPAPAGDPTAGAATQPGLTPRRSPFSLNPDIAVIIDALSTYSPNRGNDAYNRLDVREAELDLRGALHPSADGVLVLAFERDVENPIFAEDEGEEGGGPESSATMEEGYVFLHNFGVPNLTAKLGRFHLRFGRQNLLHLHDLPTTDPPFVNQAFLSPEALTDSGVSLSYLLPQRVVGGQYVEVIAEIVSGEGAGSESPVLGGDLSVDSPATNLHALWNGDIGRDLNVELGGSWLRGHREADNALDADLFGVDVTLIRTDPGGGFRNTLFQAEAIYGLIDTDEAGRQEPFGVYLLGQQQLNRDWYAGARLDWTQNPDDQNQEAWGVTPYVSWYWGEFLRFRLSYQHRDGDREDEDVVAFQTTFLFGAHPPHPYWSMR